MPLFERSGRLAVLAVGLVTGGLVAGMAQQPRPGAEPSENSSGDRWQRASQVYHLRTTADSGWQRGEEIYYFKCWMCHNKYARTGPSLHDLYRRSRLASGEPVSDSTVREKILEGAAGMPAYRHTLSQADMEDLLSYLREKCCFESEEPPRNPRYRH